MDIHGYLLAEMHDQAASKEAANEVREAGGAFKSRNTKEALEFLRNAGFGLFIHWSLDAQLGCVISHSLVGASKDYVSRYYEELPKLLEEGRWDFAHMARLSRLAGFQYAVLTTKHHNGFCLFDTETTDFQIWNTAVRKDLVAEYVRAFRAEGIKVGLYFSPEDFWFLRKEGLPITRSPREPYEEDVLARYRMHIGAQMKELMGNYGPIDVLFFDGGESFFSSDGLSLQQYVMNLAWDMQPKVLITRGAIPTPEQGLPEGGADEPWEACITLGSAWQYQPTNEVYKSGREAVRLLMETRAKGGTLLLNIGPDARGEIPKEQENILREIAMWQFINGECVQGVRPWVLSREGKLAEEEGFLLVQKQTGVDHTLYAVLLQMEDFPRSTRREFLLRTVRSTDKTEISVLGQSGEETEYRPALDARPRFEDREEGLFMSVMNAQRIYCGSEWKAPLVIRLTHVKPRTEGVY